MGLIDSTTLERELAEALEQEQRATDGAEALTYTKSAERSNLRVAMVICKHLEARIEQALKAATALRSGGGMSVATAEALADSVKAYIDRRLGDRVMRFEGPHDPGKGYGPGSVVQRGSGVWVAMAQTTEMPGASAHWRKL